MGGVVIGSLLVYQIVGAGSNPVASTTVLTVVARSIGNGQKSCGSFAWEGLERLGPFPIPPAYRATPICSRVNQIAVAIRGGYFCDQYLVALIPTLNFLLCD